MKPARDLADTVELHLQYLDRYRGIIEKKLTGLSDSDLRSSRLPSGWTPLELLKHLVFMERRWLRWGFTGEPVEHPWGDSADDPDGPWRIGPDDTLDKLLSALDSQAERSRAVIARHGLDEVGVPGERWDGDPPATLERVLFHLAQEYARHIGHLDIVCELAGAGTGE